MKCRSCDAELPFAAEVLAKMKLCPFCGAAMACDKPTDSEDLLNQLVSANGKDIFCESRISQLYAEISSWPASGADLRDILMLLCLKNIPSKLYNVSDASEQEQSSTLNECVGVLCDKFGINEAKAKEMVGYVKNPLGLKGDYGTVSGYVSSSSSSSVGTFTDSRDGKTYKTVTIGNQVWLAENLKFDSGKGCSVYDNDFQYLDKYGYLYTRAAANKAVPAGWHIPTVAEVETFMKNVAKINCCKDIFDHIASKDWPVIDKLSVRKIVKDLWPRKYKSLGFSFTSPSFRSALGNALGNSASQAQTLSVSQTTCNNITDSSGFGALAGGFRFDDDVDEVIADVLRKMPGQPHGFATGSFDMSAAGYFRTKSSDRYLVVDPAGVELETLIDDLQASLRLIKD